MKSFKALSMFLLISFLAFSCGDNGDDKKDETPTGGGATSGSLTKHEGANEKVTIENIDQVTVQINSTAWQIFGRAMQTAAYKDAAISDYTQKLKGDVDGLESGKASVDGKYVVKMTGTQPTSYDYAFTCTFFDFSDDGEIYLGGSMTYSGSYNLSTYVYRITIKGNISFNGAYEGSEVFTTTIEVTQTTQTMTTTTKVTSGGETFETTYSY